VATVKSELLRLFPQGTQPGVEDLDAKPTLDLLPDTIADVFAAAAHLLEASGAYQFIVAPFVPIVASAERYDYETPTYAPVRADIEAWTQLGRKWAVDWSVRSQVEPYWSQLLRSGDSRLVMTPSVDEAVPDWWAPCHALLVIADEASSDFGYDNAAAGSDNRWANRIAGITLESSTERREIPSLEYPADQFHLSRHVALDSLGTDLERHVVRVFPKGRTTEVGCTLRTFSHNLTLLPPHGKANAYWHQPSVNAKADGRKEMNVLLVPFPYGLPDGVFVGSESAPNPGEARWGRFRVNQHWLRPGGANGDEAVSTDRSRRCFSDFVLALLAEAGEPVDGVVFPELALDWDTYDLLVRDIRDKHPEVEFLVSGVSSDCNGRSGNQVTTTIFHQNREQRVAETHSRRKHHRWKLDRTQIDAYGVSADLDPEVTWWEHLSVEERVLHIDVLREGSTMTAVICEDLARVEPGLSLLRSLGPNLVFALLMDGPQIERRWPGTYATTLADDPGSSVLSLTCLGMVSRSNAARAARKPESTSKQAIALWKNRPGPDPSLKRTDMKEIELETNHHAVLLQLTGERAHETTLDGRLNDDTIAWYYRGHRSFRIDNVTIDGIDAGWIVENA
jgi:hypothetical protein